MNDYRPCKRSRRSVRIDWQRLRLPTPLIGHNRWIALMRSCIEPPFLIGWSIPRREAANRSQQAERGTPSAISVAWIIATNGAGLSAGRAVN